MNQGINKARIVVLGYIVRGPLGGLVWHHLQYMIGLSSMGFDVLFIEYSEDYASCYDPSQNGMTTNPAYGLRFLAEVFKKFSLEECWAYHDEHENVWFGKSEREVTDFCNSADLLINLSGVNSPRAYCQKIPLRILIDTDPVFTQVRHLDNANHRLSALCHNRFFSFAENIGHPGCTVPNDGFDWKPTRQPVFLDAWVFSFGKPDHPWTTVMQWDSYLSVEHNSLKYGMKSSSFGDYMDIPKLSGQTFELAIGSDTAPNTQLLSHGWNLADPLTVTKTPASYQEFIRNSKGEWSVAKHGYVISKSGWFSERSACYLASGRPVLVQDTGFSARLETGRGLLAFNDEQQCLEGIFTIDESYQKHCRWAREMASAFFDHRLVLNALLEAAQ